VRKSFADGYRPDAKRLLDGVAVLVTSESDDDAGYTAKQLAMAGRFLKSIA